jgi:hypothetical protein
MLYAHFDQIIFYDLDIAKRRPSSDGSNEYIRSYPDPEKKITLLQGIGPLQRVKKFYGQSLVEKRKMFAAGSACVRDDIDVFWCTDMDEFFKVELIAEVERQFHKHPEAQIINLPHLIFLKNLQTALVDPTAGDDNGVMLAHAPRIIRHKPGRIYGHCPALAGNQLQLRTHSIYHFSYVGLPRVIQKMLWRIRNRNYPETLEKCRRYLKTKFLPYRGGVMEQAHPEARPGIPLNNVVTQDWPISDLPQYIDVKQLERDLNTTDNRELIRDAKKHFGILL